MRPGATRRRGWQPLLVLATLLAVAWQVLPRISRETTLTPAEVGVKNPHSLTWTPAPWTVHSGRDDPHFELVLPLLARPVKELTFEVEPIWGNVGAFRFYCLPINPPKPFFYDEGRVDVEARIYGPASLAVVFPEPMDRIRFDPPDAAEFILKSVVVRAYPGQQPVVRTTLGWLTLGSWLATGLVFFWPQCRAGVHWVGARPRWTVLALLGLLLFARLGLTATQPLKAVGGAIHDDQHFIDQAASILAGHWLGDYNQLTLIKGQGYPLWIAATYRLGVPLVLAQHLLYAAAAALAYAAWRPVLTRLWRLAVVAVVLFNPAAFHGDDAGRVLRNHFCASLALLCFVCVTGWFLRLRRPVRAQLGWAVGAGTAFSALWLTREEMVWMTGVIGLVALAGVPLLWREGRAAWRRLALTALAPVAICVGAVTTVCAVNYSYYRFWGTVEFRASAYRDAYGALARINVGPWRQYVPVSREAREAAYPVSATFARLQPYLEGDLGVGWASMGVWQVGLPATERQIHGAGFMWALRDAAAAAGEHENCPRAMSFYRRMADEINAACDAGKLPAFDRRSGFVPPWRSEFTWQLPPTYLEAWRFISTFAYVVPQPPPSSGPEELLSVYRKIARTPLSPRLEDPPRPAGWGRLAALNNGVLTDLTQIYAITTPFAVAAALPLLAWLWLRVRRGRASYEAAVLATAALAGTVAITLIVSLIQVTSFVGITIGYQAAAYPLLLLFVSLTAAGLLHSFARNPVAPAV